MADAYRTPWVWVRRLTLGNCTLIQVGVFVFICIENSGQFGVAWFLFPLVQIWATLGVFAGAAYGYIVLQSRAHLSVNAFSFLYSSRWTAASISSHSDTCVLLEMLDIFHQSLRPSRAEHHWASNSHFRTCRPVPWDCDHPYYSISSIGSLRVVKNPPSEFSG